MDVERLCSQLLLTEGCRLSVFLFDVCSRIGVCCTLLGVCLFLCTFSCMRRFFGYSDEH